MLSGSDLLVTSVFALVAVLFGSLALAILAAVFPRPPKRIALLVFGIGCGVVMVTGIASSGAIFNILALGPGAASFAVFGLTWRSHPEVKNRAASCCYWIGIPAVILGAIHLGADAYILNAIATNYHPESFTRPNIPVELLIWCMPACLVSFALKLSGKFNTMALTAAAVSLLSVNPVVLWVAVMLRLPASM